MQITVRFVQIPHWKQHCNIKNENLQLMLQYLHCRMAVARLYITDTSQHVSCMGMMALTKALRLFMLPDMITTTEQAMLESVVTDKVCLDFD